MSDQHTYGDFNSDDIRRYLEGRMSPEEMHRIEKAALDDPFLADAMEGFAATAIDVKSDLAELGQRLSERTEASDKKRFGWWRIAAMLILVLGASTAAWYLSKPIAENPTLAKNEELRQIPATDTPTAKMAPAYDSTATANRNFAVPESIAVSPKISGERDKGKTVETEMHAPSVAAAELKVNEPSVSAADQQDKKMSVASVEKQKLAKEKSATPGISSLPKDADIAAAGARSKNEAAPVSEDKIADARKFAPAKSAPSTSAPSARQNSSAPSYYFKGRVTDENNQPVPYASIRITNAQGRGTYTDVQGRFSMVSSDSILYTDIISVGYNKKKVTLQAISDPVQIHLETSSSALNETVVRDGRQKTAKAEEDTGDVEEKTTMPHAEPADGWSLYEIYIKNNLRVPVTPGAIPLKGTVTVSFYVDPEKGRLYDFRIEKSLGILHDKEAIRVLKDGPTWDVYNTDSRLRTSYTIVF